MENEVPIATLKKTYDAFFQVLTHRRSRRISIGGMAAPPDYYKTDKKPVPLSQAELALLCYAGAGYTGLIATDQGSGPSFISPYGRTFPSPCNHQATRLIFTNDDGIFLYDPKPVKRTWAVEGPEDLKTIIQNFDKDVIKLKDGRLESARGTGAFSDAIGYMTNRPGQVVFFPIVQPSSELIDMLTLSLLKGSNVLFTDDKGKPAGVEKWIDKLNLKIKVPLSYLEPQVATWCALEAAFISQNILLAAEALGLGAFPFSGFNSLILMGGTPVMRGMGFRFTTDKKGLPNPIGIDGKLPGYCPPYYKDMAAAARAVIDERYTEGGFMHPQSPSSTLDQATRVKGMVNISDDVKGCISDLVNYIYDRAGRFPTSADTMSMPMGITAHHMDLDFYAKFMKPEFIRDVHREHMATWHSQ